MSAATNEHRDGDDSGGNSNDPDGVHAATLPFTDLPEPDPVVKVSADRARTMRHHAALERGEHPLMGGLLRQRPGETCGTCDHHVMQGGVAGTFHKCALRNTGGPATDIRVSWPGCLKWKASGAQLTVPARILKEHKA